jgi:hypothetical protein
VGWRVSAKNATLIEQANRKQQDAINKEAGRKSHEDTDKEVELTVPGHADKDTTLEPGLDAN